MCADLVQAVYDEISEERAWSPWVTCRHAEVWCRVMLEHGLISEEVFWASVNTLAAAQMEIAAQLRRGS